MVKICEVQIDAPGDDNANLNQEWIKICNNGTADVDLSNWALINNAGAFYEFPDGFILRAGMSVIVYTGTGDDTEAALFWEYPVEAWNNTSEVVTLQDGEGNTIDEYMWPPEAV
jgi:micrococcal nuclease